MLEKTLLEDQKFPYILPRKVDIAYFVKCATTIQLHEVVLIFTISLLS